MEGGERRPSFPHPLALMVAGILIAAALTWILPAGEYERREDPATGRNLVVAGTYRQVESQPVGPFQAIVAIPKGIVDAASVIALIFLIGGGFTVVERTGTFLRLVNGLLRRLTANVDGNVGGGVQVDFDVQLSELDEPQEISAP